MKKLRLKHPVWFCILMLVVAMVGGLLGGLAKLLPADLQSTTLIENCLGQIGVVLLLVIVLWRTDRLTVLGRHGMGFGKGLALFGSLIIAVAVASLFIGAPIQSTELNPPLTIAIFLIWMCAIGMSEEFECRAIMAETLLEHFGTERSGMLKAVIVSAVIFGGMHLMNIGVPNADPVGIVLQAAQAFVIGLVFAAIYFRTGNIWVCVTVHAIWDFFSFLQVHNALFAHATGNLASALADMSAISLWTAVAASVIFIVYAIIILRSKGIDGATEQWFGDLRAKMEQERAALTAKGE